MIRFDVFERDSFACIYCGFSALEDEAELEADHIVPVALNGKNVASNMATACWKCNQEKKDRSLRQTEDALILIAQRNLDQGISPNTQFYPGRTRKREPISGEQKRRNRILIRSLKRYRELGHYERAGIN